MASGLHGAISWFQAKIGKYDKANWEITVEKQVVPELSKLGTEKLSVANVRSDLLDIDLIRGSTFTKAKPSYHWTQVSTKGILRVIFFPFYHAWWRQQTTFGVWLFFVLLYFIQFLAFFLYLTHQQDDDLNFVTWPEVFVPILAMIFLGEMYIHVVSTNFTRPQQRLEKKRSPKKNRSSRSDRSNRKHGKSDVWDLNNVNDQSRDSSTERATPIEVVMAKTVNDGRQDDEDLPVLRRRCRKPDEDFTEDFTDAQTADEPIKRKKKVVQSSGSVEVSSANEDSEDNTSTEEMESDNEEGNQEGEKIDDTDTPFLFMPGLSSTVKNTPSFHLRGADDTVTVSLWDGTSFKKAKFTFLEIGKAVVNKVETSGQKTSDYITFAIFSSLLIGVLPMIYRIYQGQVVPVNKELSVISTLYKIVEKLETVDGLNNMYKGLFGPSWEVQVIVIIAMVSRISLSFSVFFLMCVAEAAFKQRYRYAKYFGALTSTRKARRYRIPHFRLHKVKNIKAWISLRSYLKKRGPQRSVDTIVSMSFIFGIILLVTTCVQFLSLTGNEVADKEDFLSYFYNWEVSTWCFILGVFLVRFISLGAEINRKYRNNTVLLTEQINLYLQMENSPDKKDQLIIANNVLNLATKLLKELEGPFKVSGVIMNPLLSNIIRVVVLSLFSGVMSDILGFRLRLWKIKA